MQHDAWQHRARQGLAIQAVRQREDALVQSAALEFGRIALFERLANRRVAHVEALADCAHRQLGAAHLTLIAPYLAYMRQDMEFNPGEAVSQRIVGAFLADLFDAVVTVEVHNLAAFQNAFRCPAWHLDTHALFARHLAPQFGGRAVTVVSPDAGGVKRAQLFREMLEATLGREVGSAFMEKRRSAGVVSVSSGKRA